MREFPSIQRVKITQKKTSAAVHGIKSPFHIAMHRFKWRTNKISLDLALKYLEISSNKTFEELISVKFITKLL